MKKQLGWALGLAWIVVCCQAGLADAVRFRYENLGTLGGDQSYTTVGFNNKEAGINEAGQVVGKSFTATGALHAFIKSPGRAMVDLGALTPAGSESVAPCLNSSGVVYGWYKDGSEINHASQWTPLLPATYEFADLGGTGSRIHGVNAAGYLVGIAIGSAGLHGHVLPPGGDPLDLGALPGHSSSIATVINNARTIVGYSRDASGPTACYWSPDGAGYAAAADLFGVAEHGEAYAVNNAGQAVGGVSQAGKSLAVVKSPGLDLQYLGELITGGSSTAYDINDSGWIVGSAGDVDGTKAFLWTPEDGMQNLNDLVVNLPAGVRLEYAMAINKHGAIAGYTINGVFKLTPIVNLPLPLLLLE